MPVDELECEACGTRGQLRAAYGAGDEDEPERELVVFCGDCWAREFSS